MHNRNWVLISCAVVVVAAIYAGSDRVYNTLNLNLARVISMKTLWEDTEPAIARQSSLALAAHFLAKVTDTGLPPIDGEASGIASAMITSTLIAQHHWRQDRYAQASVWLTRASTDEPLPLVQGPLLVPKTINISADGSLILAGASPVWHVRDDTRVEAYTSSQLDGSGILGFKRHAIERNRAVFEWNYPLSILYHHTFIFNVKVDEGCSLQIETVTDDRLVRHTLQPNADIIHHGTGEWEQLMVTTEGIHLRFIYLLLDVADAATTSHQLEKCTLHLASVTLESDYLANDSNLYERSIQ